MIYLSFYLDTITHTDIDEGGVVMRWHCVAGTAKCIVYYMYTSI